MIMKGKKLVVPIIALMVSAVALFGVVYAATTTVSNNGGVETPDVYTIDLYSNEAGTTLQTSAYSLSGYTFYTTKVVGGSLVVKIDPTDASTIGYVGAKDETGNFVASTITSTLDVADGYSGAFAQSGANLVAAIHGTTVTVSAALVDSATENVKAIQISIAVSGTSSLTDANAAAQEIADAVDALQFNLSFSAPIA